MANDSTSRLVTALQRILSKVAHTYICDRIRSHGDNRNKGGVMKTHVQTYEQTRYRENPFRDASGLDPAGWRADRFIAEADDDAEREDDSLLTRMVVDKEREAAADARRGLLDKDFAIRQATGRISTTPA